ncbi:MAG TPA: hypothetical protein PLU81_11185 [Deltaproteobacteria bacterium]|nr:hypothetical protein [Deltaproteobacteria bacterium]HPJ92302.1 hypothetical protein [Deltaproteobacteria bacterium]HPR52343.1 hypothetical protein [Deltaproteobacteria bacterium]
MDIEQGRLNMIKGNDGMVLVMVLLVLMASILIGMFSMRSSNIEIKISGNELAYKQDFYTAEGAAEFLIANFAPIVNNLSGGDLTLLETRDITADVQGYLTDASIVSDARILITYERHFEDPPSSGLYTDHYKIVSRAGDHEIEVGIEW